MTVEVKDLLDGMRIADKDGNPTSELLELIQRLVNAVRDHEERIKVLEP